jgi:hypothetical protein
VTTSIAIRHVVITHQVADAIVTAPDGTLHRVGHLPQEGWFCTCIRGRRCPAITQIRDLVPAIGPPPDPATTP